MDLVSFDTKGEFEMFREIMDRGESLAESCFLNIRVDFFGGNIWSRAVGDR